MSRAPPPAPARRARRLRRHPRGLLRRDALHPADRHLGRRLAVVRRGPARPERRGRRGHRRRHLPARRLRQRQGHRDRRRRSQRLPELRDHHGHGLDRREADPAQGHGRQHGRQRLRHLVRRSHQHHRAARPSRTSTDRRRWGARATPSATSRRARRSTDQHGPATGTSVIVAPPAVPPAPPTPSSGGRSPVRTRRRPMVTPYMTRTCASWQLWLHRDHQHRLRPAGLLLHRPGRAAAVGTTVTLQIYDPAMVENGDTCDDGPKADSSEPRSEQHEPVRPRRADPLRRRRHGLLHRRRQQRHGGTATDFVTSYVLRSPTDTYQPKRRHPDPELRAAVPRSHTPRSATRATALRRRPTRPSTRTRPPRTTTTSRRSTTSGSTSARSPRPGR